MQYYRFLLLVTLTAFLLTPTSWAEEQNRAAPRRASKQELNRVLLAAVQEKSEEKTLEALNRGADVNARDRYGRTALMEANEAIARLLFKRGASLRMRDKFGQTALFHSTTDLKKLELLLDHGADVNSRHGGGDSVLLEALTSKNASAVSLLKQRGARMGLSEFVAAGELKTARRLLAESKPSEQEKARALRVAIATQQSDMIKLLLANRANVNLPDLLGRTALVWAIDSGDMGLVRLIVEHGADLRARDKAGFDPLMLAIINYFGYKAPEIVPYLMEKGADVHNRSDKDRIYGAFTEGLTAFHLAATEGRTDLFPLLRRYGADPNSQDKEGNTPLFCALTELQMGISSTNLGLNYEKRILVLIENGADPNIPNYRGMTPLMEAARWNHLVAVQALLKGGANVHLKDKRGCTALAWAGRFPEDDKDKAVVQALLNAGAKVGLIEAMQMGDRELAKRLLAQAANLKQRGPHNDTALMIAVEKGYTDIVAMLLARGVDVNAQDDDGYTALRIAIAGHPQGEFFFASVSVALSAFDAPKPAGPPEVRHQIVKMLLTKGAKVNVQPRSEEGRGNRPLMLAVQIGDAETVQLLLARGADVNARTYAGDTAWDYAVKHHRQNILSLLQKAGAKSGHL
jgi:ankyrin repeat protein